MLDILVESNRRGRRDVRGTMLGMFSSTAFQTAVMIGAVYGTMATPQAALVIPHDTIILFPSNPVPEEHPEQQPVVTTLQPLPIGFRTLDLPTAIPTEIPPIDPGVVFDPRNYTGSGIEGGVFDGDPDATVPADSLSRLYQHAVVDEKPVRISCPTLEYPRMLRQANIEGQVLLRFIVEADGHVLSEHIETLSSSHRAFDGPATEMVSACLFRPGRVRATAVRVLVEMPIIFSLTGGR